MIEENISLKKLNSFGIDARTKYFGAFSNVNELKELLEFQHANKQGSLVLGGGSNMLLTKDFDGIVLKNNFPGIEKVNEDDDHIYLKAGGGVNWHSLVMYAVDHDMAGMENLSLIPGNTGASPMQNIGAYGVELMDIFYELEAFNLGEQSVQIFRLADCEFGYRESVFKKKYKGQFVILSVTFRLKKKPVYNTSYGAINQELEAMGVKELSIKAISQAVINIRSSKLPDPKVTGNAGSFFKNPEVSKEIFSSLKDVYPAIVGYDLPSGKVKLAAGWMIEQAGWKGYRRGDAGCHARQALVLVNYGHATGQEIFKLSTDILNSVEEKFGVKLEREVNII